MKARAKDGRPNELLCQRNVEPPSSLPLSSVVFVLSLCRKSSLIILYIVEPIRYYDDDDMGGCGIRGWRPDRASAMQLQDHKR